MYLIFIMVVLYVGGRVVVEVDVIQHKRVTCVEEGGGFYSTHPLTAVSTHEEHHFPVYYGGVTLNPSVGVAFSRSSSLSSLV